MWHGEIMKKRGRKSNFQPNTIIQIEPPLLWLLSPPNKWPILKGGNQSTNSDYLRNMKSKQGGGLVRKSNLKMEGGVVSFSLFFLFSFLPCPEGSPGHKTLQLCFFGSENQEKQSSQTRECGRICLLSLSLFSFQALPWKQPQSHIYKVAESITKSERKSGFLAIGLRKEPLGARECSGNYREEGAGKGDPLILHMNGHRSAACPWAVHVQERLRATEQRLWELNYKHKQLPAPQANLWVLHAWNRH